MEGLDKTRPVSLYVHIPFCRRKCDYCAFYSRAPKDNEEIEKYFRLLLAETRTVVEEVGMPFQSIYIGGGNPGLLGVERLRTLLGEAEKFGIPHEVTVEFNPEEVSEEIYTLKPFVTRISMGLQAMDDKTLETLGRRARRKDNLKALEILSRSTFNWNADIIAAVPGTSIGTTLGAIKEVASYAPDHISYYCLTFEEGTPLVEKLCPLGEDQEAEYLEKGWKLLKELGYEHYEISAFARDGHYSIHNIGYWNLSQYIGLGPTAESSLGYSRTVGMRNTESLEEYFSSPAFTCERLTEEETEETFLMTSLRTRWGIDKKKYSRRFGGGFNERYEDAVSTLEPELFLDSDTSFALTEKGMMKLDRIILSLALSL